MKLIADIGNSRCRLALFDADKIISKKTYETAALAEQKPGQNPGQNLSDLQADFDFAAIDEAVLIAVVDEPTAMIAEYLTDKGIACHIVGKDEGRVGKPGKPGKPEKIARVLPCRSAKLLDNLGADRAMNILGGGRFLASPFVVVDYGTATTVDYCDAEGLFAGGVILPGARLMAQALHDHTAKLPLLHDIQAPPDVIGDSTENAIAACLTYGYGDMVGGLIDRIRASESPAKPLSVILCGGMSDFHSQFLKNEHILEKDLTLWGGWCYSQKD